ncbi:MAG TPA: methyltransferase, partial [Oxalobacteraceae bacterium]|nr:methyltransferase [Oxalobacteraceae bacterium]
MDINTTVLERYSAGAKERQAALCCPVDYASELLAILPQEIIEKDYGCG